MRMAQGAGRVPTGAVQVPAALAEEGPVFAWAVLFYALHGGVGKVDRRIAIKYPIKTDPF